MPVSDAIESQDNKEELFSLKILFTICQDLMHMQMRVDSVIIQLSRYFRNNFKQGVGAVCLSVCLPVGITKQCMKEILE